MQQIRSQVTERDGLFELEAGSDVLDSPRYNHDMAPTKVRERTWNKWHITALWVGMAICVPTYTLGGVLTAYDSRTGEAYRERYEQVLFEERGLIAGTPAQKKK